jgi:hypothetical protein
MNVIAEKESHTNLMVGRPLPGMESPMDVVGAEASGPLVNARMGSEWGT